jgi:CRISPR-associated protein Cmr1
MHVVIETVTPLFLGDAGQRVAEIRAPSIRGALRFWFRALTGGVVGDANLQRLRELEAGVFGDTNQASSLVIRTRSVGRSQPFLSSLEGLSYLFFSVKMRQKRECLPVGLQFPLTMIARPTPRDATAAFSPDQVMVLGLCSLWLLTNLGGLGARTRRGAGSLRIVRADDELPDGVPGLTRAPRSAKELEDSLSTGLTQVRSTASTSAEGGHPITPEIPSQFSILHPAACHVYVLGKTWPTWEQALDEVGQAYRAFRTRRQPDYGEVKGLLRDRCKSIGTVERTAFGLPL